MRYDSDHKQKTRDRVLKEAANAIRAEGPHRIAVAGVMAKAGLTHGGFYAHFTSKDELVAAAIDTMFGEAQSRFRRETAGSSGPPSAQDRLSLARASGGPAAPRAGLTRAIRRGGRRPDGVDRRRAGRPRAGGPASSRQVGLGRDGRRPFALAGGG